MVQNIINNFVKFFKNRNYNIFMHINLIVIWRLTVLEKKHNKRFISKFEYAVLEKWIYETFWGPFTMTLFTETNYIYDQTKQFKLKLESSSCRLWIFCEKFVTVGVRPQIFEPPTSFRFRIFELPTYFWFRGLHSKMTNFSQKISQTATWGL